MSPWLGRPGVYSLHYEVKVDLPFVHIFVLFYLFIYLFTFFALGKVVWLDFASENVGTGWRNP